MKKFILMGILTMATVSANAHIVEFIAGAIIGGAVINQQHQPVYVVPQPYRYYEPHRGPFEAPRIYTVPQPIYLQPPINCQTLTTTNQYGQIIQTQTVCQ